jgi:hypothetical protein
MRPDTQGLGPCPYHGPGRRFLTRIPKELPEKNKRRASRVTARGKHPQLFGAEVFFGQNRNIVSVSYQ